MGLPSPTRGYFIHTANGLKPSKTILETTDTGTDILQHTRQDFLVESRLRGKTRTEAKSDFTVVCTIFLHLLLKSFSNSPFAWLQSLSCVHTQPQGLSAGHHCDPCGCVGKVVLLARVEPWHQLLEQLRVFNFFVPK